MSREEAKAQGLKVFHSWQHCKVSHHGNLKRTNDSRCMACLQVEHDYIERIKANSLEKLREQIRREVLQDIRREQKAAEAAQLRQEKEAKKAAEKEAREQQHKQAKRAQQKAAREAAKASSHIPLAGEQDVNHEAPIGPPDDASAPWD